MECQHQNYICMAIEDIVCLKNDIKVVFTKWYYINVHSNKKEYDSMTFQVQWMI